MSQKGARHFAEKYLNQVQPRTVPGGKDKFKTLRPGAQIGLGFPGNMRGVVIQHQSDLPALRIASVQQREEFNKLTTAMAVPDQRMDLPGMQVDAGKK